ncbi:hypothetical protein CAC42_7701 [Sphaceloma murrayae]|uniref:LDB19 N-terminal domain-containing protein n=1 Tax=Sphaceloma murrayae TaxID=2082308 RepID=A0A2K1QXG0_9PEZI|nr:hypothetical protein CAC42_7701 [Sphaceloma murrayae]
MSSSKLGRLSRPFQHLSRKQRSSPVSLEWRISNERDVVVGSYLTGVVSVHIVGDYGPVDHLAGGLSMRIKNKKPVQANCRACKHQSMEIETWNIPIRGGTLTHGTHDFPFSVLLPANLPASLDTSTLSVGFELTAELHSPSTTSLPMAQTKRPVLVKQIPCLVGAPRISAQTFASEGIDAVAVIDPVLRPTAANKATISLAGLRCRTRDANTAAIWRIRKAAWKLQETITTSATACERHTLSDIDDRKTVLTKSKDISSHSIEGPWIMSEADSTAEVEFEFGIANRGGLMGGAPKWNDDSHTAEGTELSHTLVVELILVKETVGDELVDREIGTGSVRILRLPYKIIMTSTSEDCANQILPSYEAVDGSLPCYT